MSDSNDSTTLAEVQKLTDLGVVETLFKVHYASLCRTVYTIVKGKDVAEDIVQEVFLKLLNKREDLVITTSLKAYLFKSAINTALNYAGQAKKLEFLEENDLDFISHSELEENFDFKETEKDVQNAIDSLPPACRTVFLLSRFEELSYKEIAESLQISVKTVENQMGKALKVLREKLKNYLTVLILTVFVFTQFLLDYL